ncbi:hypothetical protein KGS77_03610 [Streptomyces sp. MST-110588]|nr:hypothetical protein [Streptomyces sp. MST-110588]UNO43672.1 hypothetical protein KGS77_03610 [Streptomyces sp. MST-110588]
MAGVWRWRHNPLRRVSDLLEAWTALAAALLITLGAAGVGWAVGRAAHGALLRAVHAQHQQRHLAWATAGRPVFPAPADPGSGHPASRDSYRQVEAEWEAWDGGRRGGQVTAPRPVRPGERFRVWTDDRGRITARPMSRTTAGAHAVVAGLGAAGAAAGLVEGGRRLVLWRLNRRRHRRWDQEWERAGQDWGRTGAGS